MPLRKPLRLLHVDDSSIMRKTVARDLEAFKEHYELTQASSVDEALEMIASGKTFELILTDWLMDGKTGVDLLRSLKSDPAYHHLPVIFLTSEYDSSSLLTVVTYGASGLIKKPATGLQIHDYFQKRMAHIEEAHTPKDNTFLIEAKSLLVELRQMLPLRNSESLASGLLLVESFKTKASVGKWPLLADYAQSLETAIQMTLKKEVGILSAASIFLKEFTSFMEQALADIESNRPHGIIAKAMENDLKNYQTYLAAGWFTNQ